MQSDRHLAARRLDVALALQAAGDLDSARAAAAIACEAAPQWPDAWFVLGHCYEQLGEVDEAIATYRKCLELDPADRLAAGARLALMGAVAAPARLPAAYIRTLFDEVAPGFDESLIGRLHYRGPQLLEQAVRPHLPSPDRMLAVLDLGCGTGLAGQFFRTVATRLDGIDLSPGMIGEAARRGLYDSVRVADLLEDPQERLVRYGLVLAADVLNYVGDLTPAIAVAAAWLNPDGLFAFTIEEGEVHPFDLGPGHRFRHDPTAVRAWLAALGFKILHDEFAVLRYEKRQPVSGRIFVARLAATLTTAASARPSTPAGLVPGDPEHPDTLTENLPN